MSQTRKRRPFRAAFLIAGLLLVISAALTLPGIWQETARREAYLPELEAQALRNPTDGPLLALVGLRRMEAGEYAGAADGLRQGIAAGENGEANWQALAGAVAASGDRPRALADLRLGINALPAALALQSALARARAADPSAPPPIFAAAILPSGPEPLLQTYIGGSRLNGLSEWWGRHHPDTSGFATRQGWADACPHDAQAKRLWGEALLRNRRAPEAVTALAQAVALAPRSPAANLSLADALDRAGLPPKAELQYIACLKLRPDWLPALCGVGATSLENGLTSYAVQAYRQATRAAPQSADAWVGLGRAQLKTNVAFDKALEAFTSAARLAPERVDFLDDYADALRQSSRPQEAETLLQRRLGAVPDDALAHYLLGLILRNTNPTTPRLIEAEAQTREALRLSPHNPLAEVQLGEIFSDKGQVQEAIGLFQDALARTPADQKTMLLLARAYQQAGQTAAAAKLAMQAQTLLATQQRGDVLADRSRRQPLDVGLHRQLAVLYWQTGKPEKARREAEMARLLENDPKRAAQEITQFDDTVRDALQSR